MMNVGRTSLTMNKSLTTIFSTKSPEVLAEEVKTRLEGWLVSHRTLPDGVTRQSLTGAARLLETSLEPMTTDQFEAAMKKLFSFMQTFDIPTEKARAAVSIYQDTLGHVPPDLMALAVKRLMTDWKWGKLPKPADILALVAEEHAARKVALLKARTALKYGHEGQTG